MADLDEIRSRLEQLAEELADLALDRLREAASAARDHGQDGAMADAAAAERRITRARRSVERAVAILSDRDDHDDA
ncbi:MAG TPA: hypothetical protein VFW24_15540 [Acidimicrobiales bacterium]|nr:hypothetical protein [Acidimicrobiales bacterium]